MNLVFLIFLSESIYFKNVIRQAIKDSTTASSDDSATNTPASDVATEAPVEAEATTTAEAEIEEEAADALGELDNLADLGF